MGPWFLNSAVGRYGEDVACRFLQSMGSRWWPATGDVPRGVDIVAVDGTTLVVCEVKTRTGDRCGSPAEAVTPDKVRRLRRLAVIWLRHARSAGSETRYPDCVSTSWQWRVLSAGRPASTTSGVGRCRPARARP